MLVNLDEMRNEKMGAIRRLVREQKQTKREGVERKRRMEMEMEK